MKSKLLALVALLLVPLGTSRAAAPAASPEKYPVRLVEPLAFGDEFIEVTEPGTLRRRYRVWGDFAAEMAAWKNKAEIQAASRPKPPRTFRLGCIFLQDATVVCPDVSGSDGQPLRATFSTPGDFVETMRSQTADEYSDFTYAFTRGEVKCQWVFETLSGLTWTAEGKKPAWGCQPRAIGEQIERALAKYKDAHMDMWVYCAGKPKVINGSGKQTVPGPPYGISYTQWTLFGGYSLVICAPHLPLVVHEVNHRYLDNLSSIEGLQLTLFHGLGMMGYEGGDLGYPDLLGVYRSVYLHIIRPAMWRRFSLTGPHGTQPEPFTGKRYRWDEVSDDCWFRLPLLGQAELAQLTGLPSLQLVADRKTRWRHFTVAQEDRPRIVSPYTETVDDTDVALNNFLALATESCATLRTATGHWLVVRPEVVEVYVQMLAARCWRALKAVGWLNEGVRPLVVLRAPAELAVPAREIDYFR